jgi:DNA-binding HxlR family transcriptional regulator
MTMPFDQTNQCPVARALDVMRDRWTFLILRDLRNGAKKFHELQHSLGGISPNTLSARLKHLEENEIIERRFYEDHPPRAEYLLTVKGQQLRPVIAALKKWGEVHTTER